MLWNMSGIRDNLISHSYHGMVRDVLALCFRMMEEVKLMNTGFQALNEKTEAGILGKMSVRIW